MCPSPLWVNVEPLSPHTSVGGSPNDHSPEAGRWGCHSGHSLHVGDSGLCVELWLACFCLAVLGPAVPPSPRRGKQQRENKTIKPRVTGFHCQKTSPVGLSARDCGLGLPSKAGTFVDSFLLFLFISGTAKQSESGMGLWSLDCVSHCLQNMGSRAQDKQLLFVVGIVC